MSSEKLIMRIQIAVSTSNRIREYLLLLPNARIHSVTVSSSLAACSVTPIPSITAVNLCSSTIICSSNLGFPPSATTVVPQYPPMLSNPNHHQFQRFNGQIFPPPCLHLADFRAQNDSKPFRALQDCIRVKPPGGRSYIRRDPSEVLRCGVCGESSLSRLYACVACAAVSCHMPPGPSHAVAHATSMPPGHEIAVDVDHAELFCCACRDQVYDRDFDAAVVLSQITMLKSATIQSAKPENLRKRRKVDYHPWSSDTRDRLFIESGSTLVDYGSDMPRGLRGLNNLGNTCFMNSVLQAFLHTPPLRNYFLSDRHNKYYCKQKNGVASSDSGGKRKGNGGSKGNKNVRLCLACEMDALFSAVFSGNRTPYSPAKFLYSWWQHACNLASYEQQDAHEFFISILDGIHEKMEKDCSKPHSKGCGFRSLLLA